MSNPRYRSSGIRETKPLVFVMGDGVSEKNYFGKLNRIVKKTRIKPNELGKSGWKTILKKCKGHKSNGDVDLKHGDRLVIITDEDYKYDEETIKIFQKECEKEGFELFLSNISFETWLLMHYEKVLTPHEQQELEDRLEKHLGKPYIKSEGIPLEKTMILQAIDHANLVLPEGDNTVCFKTNPSTRVHMLVEELIKGDE